MDIKSGRRITNYKYRDIKNKKGDNVKVITGDDKGKTGNVIKVFPDVRKLLVKGINEKKKHQKPTRDKKGGIITIERPIDISNVVKLSEAKLEKKVEKKVETKYIVTGKHQTKDK